MVHGLGVDINCHLPLLIEPISRVLADFAVKSFDKCVPIVGTIRPYDQLQVRKYLSATATRLPTPNELAEIYEEDERFWLIDDHWGLCEVNLLKGHWRSWILPNPAADVSRIIERSIIWPVAQLLRARGLCITPAAAVTRDGWGALILSNFSIEPELNALVRAGWRLVGQNWTALRQEHGRMMMLGMPGSVERIAPRGPGIVKAGRSQRVDLRDEFPGCAINSATCDSVLIVEPGRRPLPRLNAMTPTNAVFGVRKAWGITELHPHRRQGHFLVRLAQRCGVFEAQLSRDPKQILSILETARHHQPTEKVVA